MVIYLSIIITILGYLSTTSKNHKFELSKRELYENAVRDKTMTRKEIERLAEAMLREDFATVQGNLKVASIIYNPSELYVQDYMETAAGQDMMSIEFAIADEGEAFEFFTLYHESGHGVMQNLAIDESLKRKIVLNSPSEYAADIFALWVTRFYDKKHFDMICTAAPNWMSKLPGNGITHPSPSDRIKGLNDNCQKLKSAQTADNTLKFLETLIKNYLDIKGL